MQVVMCKMQVTTSKIPHAMYEKHDRESKVQGAWCNPTGAKCAMHDTSCNLPDAIGIKTAPQPKDCGAKRSLLASNDLQTLANEATQPSHARRHAIGPVTLCGLVRAEPRLDAHGHADTHHGAARSD